MACCSLEVIREVSAGPVMGTESGSLDIGVSASELSLPLRVITKELEFKQWTIPRSSVTVGKESECE